MDYKFDIKKYRHILMPRFDTFGDIVLLEGFIRMLLDLLPEARIVLLVRNGYEQLAGFFPHRLIWKTVNIINPHKGNADAAEKKILFEKLNGDSYDLILFTAYNRTWADDLVAAKLTSALRVALGESGDIHDDLLQLLRELEIDSPPYLYDEFISVEERIPETEKYQLFWQQIRGKPEMLPAPHFSISEDIEKAADDVLKMLGLEEGRFIFCFPAGTANVFHKFWPAENFARVISDLEKKFNLRTLVAGHESEKGTIDKVVGLAREQGVVPKSWIGKEGDIPLVCSLAKKSLFYIGNDTGPMHMAAALDKPVVAIFGGGTWPRFVPCAKVGRVFFLPLPCFNCGWNCLFDEALCMSLISSAVIVGEIQEIVEEILKGKGDFKTVEIKPKSRQQHTMIEKAVDCLRRSKKDIELFKDQVEDLFKRLDKSELDRELRLKSIRDLGLKLDLAKSQSNERMEVIKRQENEFSKKLQEIEADRAARLEVIKALTRQKEENEQKINELQRFDIRSLGFKGVCSFFFKKLFMVFSKN